MLLIVLLWSILVNLLILSGWTYFISEVKFSLSLSLSLSVSFKLLYSWCLACSTHSINISWINEWKKILWSYPQRFWFNWSRLGPRHFSFLLLLLFFFFKFPHVILMHSQVKCDWFKPVFFGLECTAEKNHIIEVDWNYYKFSVTQHPWALCVTQSLIVSLVNSLPVSKTAVSVAPFSLNLPPYLLRLLCTDDFSSYFTKKM